MATTTIAEFMGHDHDRLDEIYTGFQAFQKQDSQKSRLLFQELLTGLHRHNQVGGGDSFSGL